MGMLGRGSAGGGHWTWEVGHHLFVNSEAQRHNLIEAQRHTLDKTLK